MNKQVDGGVNLSFPHRITGWLTALRTLPTYSWWGVLFCGLLLRVVYAYVLGDDWLAGDAGEYIADARRWRAGEFPTPFWPPGLSWYLAGWFSLFGDAVVIATLASLGWYVGLAFFWQQLANDWLGQDWALLGQGLFAISPTFIHHSVVPLSHLPVAVCLLGALFFWQRGRKNQQAGSWYRKLMDGSLLGLCLLAAVLFRPASLLVVPLYLGAAWFQRGTKQRWHLLVSLGVLALGLGMWQGRLWQETGRWIWINEGNAMNVFIGNNTWTPDYQTWWLGSHDESKNPDFAGFYERRTQIRSLPPTEQSAAYSQAAWDHIRTHPIQFIYRTTNRIRVFWAADSLVAANWWGRNRAFALLAFGLDACFLLGLSFLALLGRKSPEDSWFSYLLTGIIWLYALPYFLVFSHPTYHVPILPLLALLAGRQAASFQLPRGVQLLPWRALICLVMVLIQVEWLGHWMNY